MSIRFKFRSAANFDSLDLDGRPSISLRELRSKIVKQKKLNICQDFDLVFSDALTGHEFDDDNLQISCGSSVIIRRVPSGLVRSDMAPLNAAGNIGTRNFSPIKPIVSLPMVMEEGNSDDFGAELCPVPEAALSAFDKNCFSNEVADSAAPRLDCQKLEASDFNYAIPGGPNNGGTEENIWLTKLESEVEKLVKLEKVENVNFLAVQNSNVPSELKCPICNTFFKDAVMIPCCQHSFCEKCIRKVLADHARCPKCSSSKCRAEDLLPNLSLREAIQHFLESQIFCGSLDAALHKYAPDGESGIQAKEVSCALTVFQRELDSPYSPSATEKGSNQVMAESVLGGRSSQKNNLGVGKALKSAPLPHRVNQIKGEKVENTDNGGFLSRPEDLADVSEFQGENEPLNVQPTPVAADSELKRTSGLWAKSGGGNKNFTATLRHKKGDRTCYMCGSPDHFIKDCPGALSPHPMLQTGNVMFPGALPGYLSPCWNGNLLPPIRPFTNIYGSPGMMPFGAPMVPVTPFGVRPYVPSMYGGLPTPSGYFRNECLVSPPLNTGRPLNHSEFSELQDREKRHKVLREDIQRGKSCDDHEDFHKHHHYGEPERSREYKSRTERGKCANRLEDSFTWSSEKKHKHDKPLDDYLDSFDERHRKSSRPSITGRNKRPNQLVRSHSGEEDSRSSDRDEHHHGSCFKKHERMGQCESNPDVDRRQSGSRTHHQTKNEKDIKRRRDDLDLKGHIQKLHGNSGSVHIQKLHGNSGSGLEPSSSSDRRKPHREKDSSHNSRPAKHRKPIDDERSNERWQMVSGLGENYREDYHHHKKKRIH